ncbi:unnamed protein product [Cladocopium goreaui]|uniref:Uncharacterized protein n=1 Tax=Cladocopium goreaui TaxID=2562237 RepID=A0A9P1DVE3_9DINO|nr:unnamed protein product [Cladocopium goreaui]
MEQKRLTTQRKRSACGQLRTLALELGVEEGNAHLDMTIQQFDSLANDLEMRCTTPQQHGKLRQVVAHFHNRPASAPLTWLSTGDCSTRTRRQRSGSGWTAVPAAVPRLFVHLQFKPLWGAHVGRLPSLDWNIGVSEALECDNGAAVDWTSLRCVVFVGVRPDAAPCTARGPRLRQALDHGHFYVYANKVGTLRVETSGYIPWEDYPVKGWWLDNLWTEHKLSHDVYLEYSYRVRIGFMGRQRQIDCVREHERKLAFQAQQRQVADALALLMRPFRPEVLSRLQPWVSQYQSVQLRYKFLVLRGGSQTGKSTLAKSLGHLFGWRRPFVQTVQSAEAPDLKAYSPEEHGYILFDNVNHMDFILNERALFQANNDLHTLGASRTGIYSYSVWLFRCPLVVTVDLSAVWEGSEPWLADNMFELFLDGPCYL